MENLSNTLVSVATDTDRVASDFLRSNGSEMANENRYFRFNVPSFFTTGLGESKNEGLAYLREMTSVYFDQHQTAEELLVCSTKLAESASVSLPDINTPGRE
jgi:hypothetical protein